MVAACPHGTGTNHVTTSLDHDSSASHLSLGYFEPPFRGGYLCEVVTMGRRDVFRLLRAFVVTACKPARSCATIATEYWTLEPRGLVGGSPNSTGFSTYSGPTNGFLSRDSIFQTSS